MKKGSELSLLIEKFADKGKSLGRVDGYVVFVKGAVPGDRVRVRITRRKKGYAEGIILSIEKEGPLHTDPRCDYFGTCGGCKWQHVRYDAQIDAKKQSVSEALEHMGGFTDVKVLETIGTPDLYYYRNKMEFSFSAQRWLTKKEIQSDEKFDTGFALGLHVPGNFAKVVDIHACHLQSELSSNIVNEIRSFALKRKWKAWHTRKHTGYLRHLVIREGKHTNEVMVNLVTSSYVEDRMVALGDHIRTAFPQVTTLVNTINSGVAQTAFGEQAITVFGSGVIHDKIGNHRFQIAPDAFFQTNTTQAEKLYEVVRDFADPRKDDLLYDLYCGAGTISHYMSNSVREIVGVELIESAVQNAKENAKVNEIKNCTFVQGDMMRLFTASFIDKYGKPDVLIVDPPRAGMHKKVVAQIGALRPERFIYVSCNPRTQARDLALLKDQYEISKVQPVDLFPHTDHIENVIKLSLKST